MLTPGFVVNQANDMGVWIIVAMVVMVFITTVIIGGLKWQPPLRTQLGKMRHKASRPRVMFRS